MSIGKISFGSVIAISGKEKRVRRVNQRLRPQTQSGKVMLKDVTRKYMNAAYWGVMAQAAQRGDKVEIYITGTDVQKVKKRDPNWDSIDGILSNLTDYHNVNETPVQDVVDDIINA